MFSVPLFHVRKTKFFFLPCVRVGRTLLSHTVLNFLWITFFLKDSFFKSGLPIDVRIFPSGLPERTGNTLQTRTVSFWNVLG